MKKLENKVAIITGAASGIGRATATLFAREGCTVVLADIQEKELESLAQEIKKDGGTAKAILCDVKREDNIQHLFRKTIEEFNHLHILINNAGIMDDFITITELSKEKWEQVLQVNLTTNYYTCHYALNVMLNEKKGIIVNVASVGGLNGARAGAAYTVSKHGLIGLTKNIGFVYANEGIRCNAVAPGGVKTNITRNMKPSAFGYQRAISGSQNMPRLGEPEEIANIILFLSNDESSYINGAVITADAGWTAY